MKITFILSTVGFYGGIRVVSTHAKILKKRGHDVFVVSIPQPRPSWKIQIKSVLRGRGWITMPKKTPSHLDSINVPHHQLSQYRPVTDADLPDADVVIATWWETAEWVADLSPAKGAKAYFIQHHEIFDYLPVDRVKATWKLPLHKLVVSQWLADLARTEYGDSQTTLVPNSVDTTQFYAQPRNKQTLPTVGMMYANVYWKGVDIGLAAVALATQTIPDLQLLMFGDCPWSTAHQFPENGRYTQLPNPEQLRNIYASCDVWLFMSRIEGYGLPILEAMACRTPVIGTPAGAAPDLLADGAGILVEPENPQAVAEAIIHVCQRSNQEWRLLSDQAYARATAYTWDDATDLFEQGLQSIRSGTSSKAVLA